MNRCPLCRNHRNKTYSRRRLSTRCLFPHSAQDSQDILSKTSLLVTLGQNSDLDSAKNSLGNFEWCVVFGPWIHLPQIQAFNFFLGIPHPNCDAVVGGWLPGISGEGQPTSTLSYTIKVKRQWLEWHRKGATARLSNSFEKPLFPCFRMSRYNKNRIQNTSFSVRIGQKLIWLNPSPHQPHHNQWIWTLRP